MNSRMPDLQWALVLHRWSLSFYNANRHREFQSVAGIFFRKVSPYAIGIQTIIALKHDHGPGADGAASCHPTDWAIDTGAAPGAESALAEMCRCYWCILYSFARRRGYS